MSVALRNICRFLVGGLFVFSGFVKIVDPVGMSIKLDKYFMVFDEKLMSLPQLLTIILPLACLAAFLLNLKFFMEGHWWKWVLLLLISLGTVISYYTIDSTSWNGGMPFNYTTLSGISLFFSVLLLVLEISLGIALITLYRMKFTSWALLLLIGFFTWLTLFTAITGQPTDCGCFGDFMKLSPWTSFWKDVVLLAMILVIFVHRDKFKSVSNNLKGAVFNLSVAIFWVFFANYSINHLPLWDLRNYKVGTDVKSMLAKPIEKKSGFAVLKDGWEVLIYDNIKNLKNEHLSPPYQWVCTIPFEKYDDTGLHFNVADESGTDVTQEILSSKVLFFTVKKFHMEEDVELAKKLAELKNKLGEAGIDFKVLLSGEETLESFNVFQQKALLELPCVTIDGDEYKTMIRARLGMILFDNGVIKGKWHINDIPAFEEVKKLL